MVCIIYITIVTLSFLIMGNGEAMNVRREVGAAIAEILFAVSETYGGNVGLAITQSIALTGMFQWGMRQSTELENQMTSVERVLEYTNVEQESALETSKEKRPPSTWPQHGKVVFSNLYLRYLKFNFTSVVFRLHAY